MEIAISVWNRTRLPQLLFIYINVGFWFIHWIGNLAKTIFAFSLKTTEKKIHFIIFFVFPCLVSRLMGGSASGSMGHMGNMGSLTACSVTDSKPMQFPLAQRRKRRVLFTQAQVCPKNCSFYFFLLLFYVLSILRSLCIAKFVQITQPRLTIIRLDRLLSSYGCCCCCWY